MKNILSDILPTIINQLREKVIFPGHIPVTMSNCQLSHFLAISVPPPLDILGSLWDILGPIGSTILITHF